jgi:hypothetical protein
VTVRRDLGKMLESLRSSVAHTTAPDIVRRLIDAEASADLHLAVQIPGGYPGLLLRRPVTLVSPPRLLPEGQGFVLSPVVIPEEPGKSTCLALFCTDRAYDHIFMAFVDDVVENVLRASNAELALEIFLSRVALWERFFRSGAEAYLSIDAQAGLFAELLVLRDLVVPAVGAAEAIVGWRGPSRAAQDFVLGDVAMEVKSSRAKSAERMTIASELQLDDRPFRALAVAFVLLSDGGRNCEGLNELVHSVEARIDGNVALTKAFGDKLLEVGWIPAHSPRYSDTRFFVRGRAYFHVKPGFPRIIQGDFPAGVGGIHYTVDVSSLEHFTVEEEAVKSWLR